jgi:hypothetical protein
VRETRRWDTDERLRGVADASALAPYVDELRDLVTTADWIAEEPEVHLLPHIERAIGAEPDASISETRVVDGVLHVDIVMPSNPSRGPAREVAYRAVASFAEAVTLVRLADGGADEQTFEVVTGMLPGSSEFATHGHRVTIRVRAPAPG